MVSVLIVNWNTRDLLRACLTSLYKHPPTHLPMEVIVVDNDSADGSAEMVESDFPSVRLIRSGSNLGYAAGNNLAFAAACGEWLLTLNPDTEVVAGTLDTAVHELAVRPDCASLSVQFIGPDKNVQHSIRGFPTLWNIAGETTKIAKLFPQSKFSGYFLNSFNYSSESYAEQPMGTFILFRRQSLTQVGDITAPFDEQFPIFFNEVDLLYRLKEAGWRCWYTPKTHILHHHGASTRQVKKSMVWESHKSLLRYLDKHHHGPTRLLLPLVRIVVLTAAFVRAKGFHEGFRPQRHNL